MDNAPKDGLDAVQTLLIAVGGGSAVPAWMGLKTLYGLWKKRQAEASAQLDGRVEEKAAVLSKRLEIESEMDAMLLARIKELEDRNDRLEESQREMFELMRKHTAESDARVQTIQEQLANEVQKVNAANWIIQQKDEIIKALTAKVTAMQSEMDELNARLQRLEVKSHE